MNRAVWVPAVEIGQVSISTDVQSRPKRRVDAELFSRHQIAPRLEERWIFVGIHTAATCSADTSQEADTVEKPEEVAIGLAPCTASVPVPDGLRVFSEPSSALKTRVRGQQRGIVQ